MEETNLCSEKSKMGLVRDLDDVAEEVSTMEGASSVSEAPLTEFSCTSYNGDDEIVAIVTKKDTINSVNMVAYNFLPEMLTQVINNEP